MKKLGHRPSLRGLAAAALFLLAGPTRAEESAGGTPDPGAGVEEVQRCVRKNLPTRSTRQEVRIENTRDESSDPGGEVQRIDAEIFWKRSDKGRSRFLVRVARPAELRGSAFLLVERDDGNDMFTYLPELRAVRRITAHTLSGSLFGTDFSYEDMTRLQAAASDSSVERLPDETLEGRPVYVLAATPSSGSGSAYTRVVSFVDRETCVALKTQLFAGEGEIAKEIRMPREQVARDGERWVPHEVVANDLRESRQTRLVVEKVQNDVDLSESFFSQAALTKGR